MDDTYHIRYKKPTMLIVDDTPINIHILAQALITTHDIQVATDGVTALNIVWGGKKPDLILLDVMMPGMDGYEVCQRIKNDPSTWNIPIIFVTARDEIADQQKGFDLGAVDYIIKPFIMPLVLARINAHLRLKRQSEHLERLALLDPLTGIPNRRSLENSITIESRRAQRDGKPLSLLMIDVDFFKAFNDHYGHGAGDECLRAIAHAIEASLQRPGDVVGRYGGEEFVVALPDCDAAGALKVAGVILQNVRELRIPHDFSAAARQVTVSIGCATKQGPCDKGDDQARLLGEADGALYLAKERGRDRIVAADGPPGSSRPRPERGP